MPYVGNDIVDLKQPANAESSRNSRFLKKVLTVAENEFIRKVDNPAAAVWSFWAAKEAAYKAMKKADNFASFLPRRWEVCLRPAARHCFAGEVLVGANSMVHVRLFLRKEFLHCIATDESGALDKIICAHAFLPDEKDISGGGASLFLRDFAARKASEHLRIACADVKIARDSSGGELGPPRLFVGGAASSCDISLSHDGRFVAFAFLS